MVDTSIGNHSKLVNQETDALFESENDIYNVEINYNYYEEGKIKNSCYNESNKDGIKERNIEIAKKMIFKEKYNEEIIEFTELSKKGIKDLKKFMREG